MVLSNHCRLNSRLSDAYGGNVTLEENNIMYCSMQTKLGHAKAYQCTQGGCVLGYSS